MSLSKCFVRIVFDQVELKSKTKMSCLTPCILCPRKFSSSRSLAKHSMEKHGKQSLSGKFYDSNLKEVPLAVTAKIFPNSISYKNYLASLACLVERINGSHHTKCEGLYFK